MAKFVKVILFLLLTVTLHGVASNVFTEKPVEQSELAITYSMKQHEQISAPDFPYAPVAELNNLQSHQISVTRIQRVQLGEYFTTLRNLLQCCRRENLCHSIGGEFIILQLLITVSHRVSTMYLL